MINYGQFGAYEYEQICTETMAGFSYEAREALGCLGLPIDEAYECAKGYAEFPDARSCVETNRYDCDLSSCADDDEVEEAAMAFLCANTEVVELSASILMERFDQPEPEDD